MMLLYPIFMGISAVFFNEVHGKTTFEDCGGPQKKISVKSGSVNPDPILYPGNVSISASIIVLNDLPASGLQMKLDLTKLSPRAMHVPCLKNIGSCTYDVCQMIQNNKDQFCPMFPPKTTCGCPLKKSAYNLKRALVVLPDFGDVFAKILKGGYNGTITFQDSNTNTEVGCIKVTFDISPSI